MTLDGESEQFRQALTEGRALVWRDSGSPYHNRLHVYVLGADGEVVDAIEAGAALADGLLAIRQVRGSVVDFSFFTNDKTYRLVVDPIPALRLSSSLPLGFRYKVAFQRHILVVTTIEIAG